MRGLLLGAINLDDAVRTDHCATGATNTTVLVRHLQVIVTLRVHMFGKSYALVGTARNADAATLALFRVND